MFRYQRVSEEIRQIKAKNFDISAEDQKRIEVLEGTMKKIYNDSQRLY